MERASQDSNQAQQNDEQLNRNSGRARTVRKSLTRREEEDRTVTFTGKTVK